MDFVKTNVNDFSEQLANFNKKLPDFATTLGVSTEELAEVDADAKMTAFAVQLQVESSSGSKSCTTFRDELIDGDGAVTPSLPSFNIPVAPTVKVNNGVKGRFRLLAKRIKGSKNYTESIGKDLGIVAPESISANKETAKAVILGLLTSGQKVLLKWKKGKFQGIHIYRKNGNGPYTQVGIDLQPDWMDNTAWPAQAETWTYKIIYIDNESEVGEFSDEASIKVGG